MTKLKKFRKISKRNIILASMLTFIGVVVLTLTFVTNITNSVILDDDVEVAPNTDLTYYLEVTYKGVDRFGVESDTNTQANIVSGYIYVEDKIPEGLTFNGFVTTEDNSIGAVSQNGNNLCMGYVVDDTDGTETLNSYHGLHYDEETRLVTFKVKNLQAGCKLVVGVKTITPETVDDPNTEEKEIRRDFYNTLNVRENSQIKNSNTVHVFMGDEFADTYNVTYSYIGDVPDNAPPLPNTQSYSSGVTVGVSNDVYLTGYQFSGWTTTDATVTSGTFKMPGNNVTFVGSFKKIDSYKVTYSIEGELPPSYIPPSEKSYYPSEMVILDELKAGDTFNGYRFLGWMTTDVELNSEGDFEMPTQDVRIVGSFEEIKYKVEYKFFGDVLPPNYEELLPSIKEYRGGETVALENISDVEGYHFLGWYKEDTFEMPSEDIVIYGEWELRRGLFEPLITKTIVSNENSYRLGDIVKYNITVTNTADYAIKNVIVEEKNSNASFVSSSIFTQRTNNIVEISTIAAHQSVVLEATYIVTEQDVGTVTNTVEIIGALADNDYYLDTSKVYKDSVSFNLQSKVRICNRGIDNDSRVLKYHIENDNYDTWLSIENDSCKYIYVDSGEYVITEVVPQEYTLESIDVSPSEDSIRNENSVTVKVDIGEEYEVVFTNKYRRQGFYKANGNVNNIVEDKTLYRKIQLDATKGINGTMVLDAADSGVDATVYYFNAADYNNVLFANKCWKIIRTTETKGVKLLYNGLPSGGKCNNTGTNSQIGTSVFNSGNVNLSRAGYMNNTTLTHYTKAAPTYTMYGRDVTYQNGVYTLVSTRSSDSTRKYASTSNYHYTCWTSSNTCTTVYYIYRWLNDDLAYVSFNGGKKMDDTLALLLGVREGQVDNFNSNVKGTTTYVNRYNSAIKTVVDNWYKSNMTNYTQYLEDTIWCNSRKYSLNSPWIYTYAREDFGALGFGQENKLSCTNTLDRFTVSAENGNGDLIYPVGLITAPEFSLTNFAVNSGVEFWTMTPYRFIDASITGGGLELSTSRSTEDYDTSLGVRPAVSLKEGTLYSSGDGSVNNPYVIVEN